MKKKKNRVPVTGQTAARNLRRKVEDRLRKGPEGQLRAVARLLEIDIPSELRDIADEVMLTAATKERWSKEIKSRISGMEGVLVGTPLPIEDERIVQAGNGGLEIYAYVGNERVSITVPPDAWEWKQ